MNSHVQDPYNVADKNAIEVRHSRGQRVGYVAKALAEKLTPLLAARKIRLAATAGPGSSCFKLLPHLPRSRCVRSALMPKFNCTVPANTVGLAKTTMRLEIHGKRKYINDERLDWCFPERRDKKVEAEKKKKEQQDLERKLMDKENEAASGSKSRARPGQNGSSGDGGGGGGGGSGGGSGGQVRTDSDQN